MFRYDFKNRNLIPPIKDDNADYLLRLGPVLAKENIQPVNVMRLRDAAFCIEHRIPLFTEEAEHRALRNNEEYNRLADRYGTDRFVIRGGQAIFLHTQPLNVEVIFFFSPKQKQGMQLCTIISSIRLIVFLVTNYSRIN